ncbi:phage holin family protein [Brevibacterium siliguriense]|uniref:phage holin family protein n=1 Tax=Brevibacterium siliguriense TaxID=1136497 RepID=UPI001E64F28E
MLSAVAFILASVLIDGVDLEFSGFVIAVVVFTVVQALMGPFVFNVARQYASAILGGIGLVSTLIALAVAMLFPGGLRISGVSTWISTTVLVWVVTALGTWILGYFILERWWDHRKVPRREK